METNLMALTEKLLNHIPENLRLNEDDINVLNRNVDFFISKADAIKNDFYDTLFSNEATRKVFHEGERHIREKSLVDWVVKTVGGKFDINYWAWQTYVGILHIKRKVSNDYMIIMMHRVSDLVISEAFKDLSAEEAGKLKTAWLKVASTVLSLISESYHYFYLVAISQTTGLNLNLLDNLVRVEVDNLVEANQKYRLT